MVVWALIITPLCWFGSPHDFWFVAPTALLATVTACLLVMVRISLDVRDPDSCYNSHTNATTITELGKFKPEFPGINFLGFGEGMNMNDNFDMKPLFFPKRSP